jgi:long-chain acyl-CoA synthetase
LFGVDVKLVDWEEGGYRVTDSVGPRGEIIMGGLHVAKGYYNMPEQTEQEFYDEGGKRWFKTGDIGQVSI